MMSKQYFINHLALFPITNSTYDEKILYRPIENTGEENFIEFLVYNGLAVIWSEYISQSQTKFVFNAELIEKLNREKLYSAAQLIRQKLILYELHIIFEKNNIEYILFKGGDLRDTIYKHPALRPVTDLDILVPEQESKRAIKLLVDAGFELNVKPENVSHETNLIKDSVTIDLHWHILRPGRTRIELTSYLFRNKVINNHHWGLNPQASLAIMLIHPVITKYLNSPVSMLIHTVDLHFLITKYDINWDEIEKIMSDAGTRKAAWCTLYWYKQMTGNSTIEKQLELFKPAFLNEIYLRFWIDHGLVQKLWNTRILIKIFFGLAIQDNLSDKINALINLLKEKNQSQTRLKEIIQLAQ